MAKAIIDYDDVVDSFFNQVKEMLIDLLGNTKVDGEYAIDLLMIAKYFERIGDHGSLSKTVTINLRWFQTVDATRKTSLHPDLEPSKI